ncbi:hypothetical protein V6N13_138679 [Hibiscus sabdariffa]
MSRTQTADVGFFSVPSFLIISSGSGLRGTIAVLSSSKVSDNKNRQQTSDHNPRYPFPELAASGRLEVQLLNNPSIDEFRLVLESSEPNIVYFQGEQNADGEILICLLQKLFVDSFPAPRFPPPLVMHDFVTLIALCLISFSLKSYDKSVYLEIPNGDKLAEALHSKGVPYVIYWKNTFSQYAACHFRQALLSGIQSSCSNTWDAFQLAHPSFRLYCLWNNKIASSDSQKQSIKPGPCLLGDPPKIDVSQPEVDMQEEDGSLENIPAIKIYDEHVNMRFLVCGSPCLLDASLLGPLEDGLNALLSIEIRGSKLHNRASAPPPPLQAGTFSRGVMTMRCDSQPLLENHIKNELIENSQLVHALSSSDESKMFSSEPRRSTSIACGASVFEVCLKVPKWASQVLRQLAPDVSYRSLVMLGIASVQGLPVASFEKDDAERLLFFSATEGKGPLCDSSIITRSPTWLMPPPPCRKRSEPIRDTNSLNCTIMEGVNGNARPK